MKATSNRKRLSNTTMVLGEKPTKTLRKAMGMWVDTPHSIGDGKVGKQHSTLVKHIKCK